MRKGLFLFSLIVAILLILSTYSYANNNIANGLNTAGSTVKNIVTDAGNSIRSGIENITNGLENSNSNIDMGSSTQHSNTSMMNTIGSATSTDGYTATRTSATDNNLMGMSATSWTWLIFGIVGIIIIALVWYYGSQYEHNNNYTNRD